jgi:hypothetical protein
MISIFLRRVSKQAEQQDRKQGKKGRTGGKKSR